MRSIYFSMSVRFFVRVRIRFGVCACFFPCTLKKRIRAFKIQRNHLKLINYFLFEMELLTQSHSYSQCNYKILCSVLFFSSFFGQNVWNALTTERYTKCVIDDFTMAHTNIELVIDLLPLRSKGIQQITQHKKIYIRTYMKNRK